MSYCQAFVMFKSEFYISLKGPKGDSGEKGDRGYTTTLNSDQFPTGIIEGPPGPPGNSILKPFKVHLINLLKNIFWQPQGPPG